MEELIEADEKIKKVLERIPSDYFELVYRNTESEELSAQYIQAKAISSKFSDDALHVALATIFKVDLLVSWNFKHLVNYNRIVKYNAINLLNGYKQVEIRSPKEVVDNEEDI